MRNHKILILTVVLAALVALGGCKRAGTGGAASGTQATAGKAAPEANLAIPTLDGKESKVSDFKGKVVLVNFWATWCQPCQVEIPWMIEFNQKYGPKGLVILGVAMDDEGKKAVDPYVKQRRFKVNGQPEPMDYPILLGSDAIADKFGGLLGLPTSYLYSRDGKKVKTVVGLANHDDLVKAIEGQL